MTDRPALPRIVRFLETIDAPDSQCPHCGANGRYILRFVVEGGATRMAMRGCAKLFPVSQIANEELRLIDKETKNRTTYGRGLGKNDQSALDAIEAFYAGHCTEAQALAIVRQAKQANVIARQRRYR